MAGTAAGLQAGARPCRSVGQGLASFLQREQVDAVAAQVVGHQIAFVGREVDMVQMGLLLACAVGAAAVEPGYYRGFQFSVLTDGKGTHATTVIVGRQQESTIGCQGHMAGGRSSCLLCVTYGQCVGGTVIGKQVCSGMELVVLAHGIDVFVVGCHCQERRVVYALYATQTVHLSCALVEGEQAYAFFLCGCIAARNQGEHVLIGFLCCLLSAGCGACHGHT